MSWSNKLLEYSCFFTEFFKFFTNIVALSDTMTSGKPGGTRCAKTSLSNSMVEKDVGADTHGLISAYLDFASMITRK